MLTLVWSIGVLLAPVLIYVLVIRPRLQARFVDTYANLDSFWERLWARTVAFRTFIVGTIGILASELPAFLESVQMFDLSWLPPQWQSTIRILTIVAMIFMRARATTPFNQPER